MSEGNKIEGTNRPVVPTTWSNPRMYLMVLVSQTVGYMTCSYVPTHAMSAGPLGYMLAITLCHIVIGIPITYMEMVIGQFSARNTIKTWQLRTIHQHVGIIMVILQVCILLYNHTMVTFNLQYFLLSFEEPKPFYTCGPWADASCNILEYNYTLNEECVKVKNPRENVCRRIMMTFREFQYFQYNILQKNKLQISFIIPWRLCIALAIATTALYMSCLKRKRTVETVMPVLTVYPYLTLAVLLTASLLQPGMTLTVQKSFDIEFERFSTKESWYQVITQVIMYLNLGTGINFNLSSKTGFRSPCHKYAVIVVLVNLITSVLIIAIAGLMVAPHVTKLGILPNRIISTPLSHIFEKTPRYLSDFTGSKTVWLTTYYSTNLILGFRSTLVLFLSMTELCIEGNSKLAKYPGLSTLGASVLLFLFCLPMLSDFGFNIILGGMRRFMPTVLTFFVFVECVSFLWCYGLDRFSEDVHFMLGIQPSSFFKLCWLLSGVVVMLAFGFSIHNRFVIYAIDKLDLLGMCILFTPLTIFVLGMLIKSVMGWLGPRKFRDILRVIPDWGPPDVVLQRSRGMFSAQAMTKEYMYRQYNLQAGIIDRQRRVNRLVDPNQITRN